MNIIRDLPPYLPENTYISLDTEWLGINKATLHRPTTGKFGCLTLCYEPDTVYFIDDEKNVPEALRHIENAIWVIQHAKFDITHLRRLVNIPPRKKMIDTMVMERILWNGYFDTFGLNDLARRYLNMYLDKSLQESFGKSTEMSTEQVQYACMDASITLQVWNEQRKHIKQNDMYIWKNVDQPALWALMEFEGFTIDPMKWLALAEHNKQRVIEIDTSLPINPRSPKQVLPLLIKNGFKKLKNTQEDTLAEAIDKYPNTKAAELARQILDSRKYSKRASTYGEVFLERHGEKRLDGSTFIHCDYWVIGAETGRTSSDKPNMQNQIAEFEFRDCYIARLGNVLIDCDYSQQEFGNSAYISGDKKMIQIFNSGRDVYIQTAKIMYDKDINKTDSMRKRMKAVVLGTDYGMSKYGLAKKEHISVDEAARTIEKFRKTFPEYARWMDKQMDKTSCTYTVLGRRAWLNPYSSQCPRNALNNPPQGTGGDQLKQSIARITEELLPEIRRYGEGGIVAIPHDEIVLDVPKEIASKIAKEVSAIMVDVANTMCPGMSFRAEPKICQSWAEKE